MRRILTGLIAGAVAVAATISPAQASSETGLSSLGSSGGYLSTELSSGFSSDAEPEIPGEEPAATSSGDDLTIAIAVLSTGGIIAAGVTWAVQQRLIANPLPGIIPNPPSPAPAPAPAPVPAPAPAPVQRQVAPAPAPAPTPVARSYKNCTAVWNAIGRSIKRGEPGYASHLDRDGDGIGCERDPR